jgi:transposase
MHDYNTILGVIELRLNNVSYDKVQNRYRIGRSGIALIMNRFKESGLSLDDLRQMPASKVVNLIYPKENLRHKDIPMPDFEKIHEQMVKMGKNADLSYLWLEYKKENPNGYQLSQFYKLYREFMIDTYGDSKVSMPVERVPGEKMYIDWVGDQPELLLDTATGELKKVHIFATTLGFSSIVYAEVFPDEKLNHCTKSLSR